MRDRFPPEPYRWREEDIIQGPPNFQWYMYQGEISTLTHILLTTRAAEAMRVTICVKSWLLTVYPEDVLHLEEPRELPRIHPCNAQSDVRHREFRDT